MEALDDISGIRHALDLFFASHMLESEEYCNKNDEKKSLFTILLCFFLLLISLFNLENDCISQQAMDLSNAGKA